jgi:protein-disulfide isomerase
MSKRAQMPRAQSKNTPTKSHRNRKMLPAVLLLVLVLAVGMVLVGFVLLQNQTARKPIEVSGRTGEGTAWGPTTAKVAIIAYSDFGCSHCRNFALGQEKQLRAEYENTGSVRFEYRHFIISPPDTANAANASECAADQGRFWDYHDLLYSQQGVTQRPFTKSNLKQYATRLGLNAQQFDDCVDADRHLDKVYRDSAEGKDAGVQGTPTFFINGTSIPGEVPYAEFKAAVDAALAAK